MKKKLKLSSTFSHGIIVLTWKVFIPRERFGLNEYFVSIDLQICNACPS